MLLQSVFVGPVDLPTTKGKAVAANLCLEQQMYTLTSLETCTLYRQHVVAVTLEVIVADACGEQVAWPTPPVVSYRRH